MRNRGERKLEERCKRTGTKWRCPEKTLPGKIYCEKHYKYSVSRLNRSKIKKTSAVKSDSSVVSATDIDIVEPYRPVIDFAASEVTGSRGEGNVGGLVNEGEFIGWFLGDTNDDFTLGGENSAGS